MLKHSADIICGVLTKLFNIILLSGQVPITWSDSFIVPIYKNKGNRKEPNNYRGISLINNMCKVFTSLVTHRINKFADSIELLGVEQAGFRKNFSTCDHIFSLHVLITLYVKVMKKKLYCCYIDYRKAFDSVPRVHLWYKLLMSGINGKLLEVIRNLYKNAKSAIKLDNMQGTRFPCTIGVRQGDNLSPLLFALYLNDLQDYLAMAYNGLDDARVIIEEFVQDDDIVVYLKLFTILYADDTVVFAESRNELQAALNGMFHYCQLWKLDINERKTKVVAYGSKSKTSEPDLTIGEHHINIVSEYTYLGVCFPCNGNFSMSIIALRNQASRAMFALLNKSRKLGLAVDVQLQLFDSLVVPIATYGCEIWGFRKIDVLEKLQLQFCKYILRVNKCTTSAMVLGELGRLPIEYVVYCKMLGFWHRLITGSNNKISYTLYKLLVNLDSRNVYVSDWLAQIKHILVKCNLYYLWSNQDMITDMSSVQFKKLYKKKLYVYYANKWSISMHEYSKCSLYKNFKIELVCEKYLLILQEPLRTMLAKFRTSNHMLPIEKGRHLGIERNDRKCNVCNMNDLGDEYHFICCCKHFVNVRKLFLPKKYYIKPSVSKFCELMSSKSNRQIVKTAKLVNCILQEFKNIV